MIGYNAPTNLPVTSAWQDFSWDYANRNLLRNTRNPSTASYWTGITTTVSTMLGGVRVFAHGNSTASENFGKSIRVSVTPNTKYTFQMRIHKEFNVTNFDVFFLGRTSGAGVDFEFTHHFIIGNTTVNYNVVSGSFTTAATETEGYIRIDNNGSNNGATANLYYTELKLEEGDVATAWCQSEEDTHNEGTLQNFAYNTQSGWVEDGNGFGLHFDGIDDSVIIPHDDTFNMSQQTMECWVKLDRSAAYQGLMELVGNDSNIRLGRIMDFGGGVVNYSIVPGSVFSSPITGVPTNQLVQLVGTYDGATMRTYMNGTLVNSSPLTQDMSVFIAQEVHGVIGDDGVLNRRLQGTVYSARIYNRALSDVEILTNYMSGTLTDNYVKDTSLVLDLNANKNTKIYDAQSEQGVINMAVATGQFTIIDYNDALSLSGYISSNQPKTQMFNPDNNSYNPDWTTGSFLALTPSLFILGSASDIITTAAITSVTWYDVTGASEVAITANATHVFSGTKSHVLTIKANETAGLPGKDYMCKIIYHDVSTNLDLTYKMNISMSRVVNGGGIADAVAWTPQGNIFKNDAIPNLSATCSLWRGSVLDTTNITTRWFIQDANIFIPTTLSAAAALSATTVTVTSTTGMVVGQSILIGTASAVNISAINTGTKVLTLSAGLSAAQSISATVKHASYDTDGGAGWRLIPADLANNITGVTTGTIILYPAYFTDIAVLMCIIKDTDATSNTYNQNFKDTVTFIDQTDPFQISVFSTGGDVFKNGVGSTTLTAKLYQAGAEIDAGGTTYTYTWTIFDKDGTVSTFNGGAATKTGKSITVGDLDVSVKATFQVAVS